MSDRKCKSAGATDTQPRNTKGARCRPSTRYAVPSVCVSILSRYSLSLRCARKYIYREIHALCSRERAADYSSRIGGSADSSAYQHRIKFCEDCVVISSADIDLLVSLVSLLISAQITDGKCRFLSLERNSL